MSFLSEFGVSFSSCKIYTERFCFQFVKREKEKGAYWFKSNGAYGGRRETRANRGRESVKTRMRGRGGGEGRAVR